MRPRQASAPRAARAVSFLQLNGTPLIRLDELDQTAGQLVREQAQEQRVQRIRGLARD